MAWLVGGFLFIASPLAMASPVCVTIKGTVDAGSGIGDPWVADLVYETDAATQDASSCLYGGTAYFATSLTVTTPVSSTTITDSVLICVRSGPTDVFAVYASDPPFDLSLIDYGGDALVDESLPQDFHWSAWDYGTWFMPGSLASVTDVSTASAVEETGWQLYKFPDDPPPGGCSDIAWTIEPQLDEQGNAFLLSCDDGFYCVRYVTSGGDTTMVSKCPWFHGLNDKMWLFGTPGANADIPEHWRLAIHISEDAACDDWPALQVDGSGGPDGGRDWVEQAYDVCSGTLKIRHWSSPDGYGGFDEDVLIQTYELGQDELPQGPGACVFDYPDFFPGQTEISCCATYSNCACPFPASVCAGPGVQCPQELACGARGGGPFGPAMTRGHMSVTFSGTPAGGRIALLVGNRPVEVVSFPDDTIEQVVLRLSTAVNADPEFQPAGGVASVNGSALVLRAVSVVDVSVISTDPGIAQPASPTNLLLVDGGDHVDLSWLNQDSYDLIQVTKGNTPIGVNIPGSMQGVTDSLRWLAPRDYTVVGWKDGMPSAPARVGVSVGVFEDPLPGQPESVVRLEVHPNPSQGSVAIDWGLPRVAAATLTILDVAGRRVRRIEVPLSGSRGGRVEWNGRDTDGRVVAPGIYFVRLESLGQVGTAKVTMIR